MMLDLRTMYVVVAITCLTLGGMQLIACSLRRFERWPALWAASNGLVGLGPVRGSVQDVVSIQLSNIVTVIGYALLCGSVKAFAGRPVFPRPYALAAAATIALLAFVWTDAGDFRARIAVVSALCCVFDIRIVFDGIRLARHERLMSAWLLASTFGLTAVLFVARTVMTVTGHIGGPDLFSGGTVTYQWMAVTSGMFITLRGFTLVLMAAERDHNRLLAQAHQDALTGAMNRNGLQRAFERLAGTRDPASRSVVSLLIIDL